MPLHSRCEALRAGLSNDKDDDSYSMEVLLRLRRWMPFIKTTSIKKKTVIVRGDSLKGNRTPSNADLTDLVKSAAPLGPGLRM